MASAKQIAWRKKFARMAKAGKFKKSKKRKVKKSKSTTHRKTLKSNPHNPVLKHMENLEKAYELDRSHGSLTIRERATGKEVMFISNPYEFAQDMDIDQDNDGAILLMLDSSGAI